MERKIGNPRGVVLGLVCVCVCVCGGGGGVIHDPSGTEIPRGVWGLIGRTIRGGGEGMDIFWNHTI